MTKTSSSKRRPANPPRSLVNGLSLSCRGVGASRSGRSQQAGRQMGHFHIWVARGREAGEGTTLYYGRCMYLTSPAKSRRQQQGSIFTSHRPPPSFEKMHGLLANCRASLSFLLLRPLLRTFFFLHHHLSCSQAVNFLQGTRNQVCI